eukprot:3863741-Heterocapsa_arctica.AAC.1
MESSRTQILIQSAYSRTGRFVKSSRNKKKQKWPDGLNPIIALIPKEGADSEGQLRPIDILPYICKVWMAIRKSK